MINPTIALVFTVLSHRIMLNLGYTINNTIIIVNIRLDLAISTGIRATFHSRSRIDISGYHHIDLSCTFLHVTLYLVQSYQRPFV